MLLGPTYDFPLRDPTWGLDFEAEVAVVLGDMPRGTRAEDAAAACAWCMLANDISCAT